MVSKVLLFMAWLMNIHGGHVVSFDQSDQFKAPFISLCESRKQVLGIRR